MKLQHTDATSVYAPCPAGQYLLVEPQWLLSNTVYWLSTNTNTIEIHRDNWVTANADTNVVVPAKTTQQLVLALLPLFLSWLSPVSMHGMDVRERTVVIRTGGIELSVSRSCDNLNIG